ncbi:MAG: biliverdin-producing heme oxygenase [Thiohalocapsa sp.]|uniref:biliverdin-producing heme oxygenase n=1 Tax=Thiohalocapsa sp. TaxID=2497641 RepID=UPI0025CF4F45|nr:biliverdin-producing heme oxygenase [Thiohalocapsa sp.]MCG6943379.1 biliverdin-producing heme oxygenase [Thiohalocapsa sp.]
MSQTHQPPAAGTDTAATLSSTPPLMRRLREHTAPTHRATEALPLMRHVLTDHPTAAGYAEYLAALQGVYLAVEPALYAATPASVITTLGIEPKLPALQQDLQALLGAAPAAPPPRPAPDTRAAVHRLLNGPAESRVAAALGGLYVLEGATLGGQVIARHLRAQWPPGVNLPTAFLEFRLEHPGLGWRGFGAALDRWAGRHPGSDRAILDGAMGVFRLMHKAFADVDPSTNCNR